MNETARSNPLIELSIAHQPLGSTEAKGYAKMINFIGEIPESSDILSTRGVHLHHYTELRTLGVSKTCWY